MTYFWQNPAVSYRSHGDVVYPAPGETLTETKIARANWDLDAAQNYGRLHIGEMLLRYAFQGRFVLTSANGKNLLAQGTREEVVPVLVSLYTVTVPV